MLEKESSLVRLACSFRSSGVAPYRVPLFSTQAASLYFFLIHFAVFRGSNAEREIISKIRGIMLLKFAYLEQ